MRIAVLAMGRLGGGEQGYGSDADVLFVHAALPGSDEREAGSAASEVAHELRRLLALPAPDPPLVVDADLRPEGKQGPLSRSLGSYAAYYARWSEVWEAQALLRASPLAGDPDLARELLALVDPLRYPADGLTDAQVAEVRRIKARVEKERMPRGVDPKLVPKLGPGGIADVEWTVQLLQLRHAAQVEGLRTTGTLAALTAATGAGLLDPDDAAVLRARLDPVLPRPRRAGAREGEGGVGAALVRPRARRHRPRPRLPGGCAGGPARGLPSRDPQSPHRGREDLLPVSAPSSTVRTVVAADTRFLLREEGSGGSTGVPVLLLHGVPETSTCWRHQHAALADGRRVLAPDLPGLGGSAYTGPYDVASLVRQLAALIDVVLAEGPADRVDVVGHDWGGSLALALAGARPDLVRRLGVLNAPYREIPLPRAAHVLFFALPGLPELAFRLAGARAVDLMFSIGWKAATPLDPDALAEYRAAYGDAARVQAMLGYYRAAARPRARAALSRTATPAGDPTVQAEAMLVLWGAQDPVLPIRTGETVVRDLGSDAVMVTVPGAGHFVQEEAPELVLEVLREFLAPELRPPYAPVTDA